MERKTHTIDASGKILGRLAVDATNILRGKNRPDYVPNQDIGDFVIIKNVSQMKFSGKKAEQKIYYHHSGYLGGMKKTPLERLFKKNPKEVLKKAVYGMLQKNKLRDEQIKRLKFE
ncbi:50S ribosomal protein L13 [Candidatus Parcubacteria bacterium]|nr:50S ribosomal protein L13 [Candidatus Parcubacteria bacterium]